MAFFFAVRLFFVFGSIALHPRAGRAGGAGRGRRLQWAPRDPPLERPGEGD